VEELILEPYTVIQRWRFFGDADQWENLISEFMETLARRCYETGKGMIGHIKALALFPNGGYLRVSVVSPTVAAGVEGSVPMGCTELVLTLNVIVYGLGHDLLEGITRETADCLTQKWKGGVTIIEAI
jgi:hypothetical protein